MPTDVDVPKSQVRRVDIGSDAYKSGKAMVCREVFIYDSTPDLV